MNAEGGAPNAAPSPMSRSFLLFLVSRFCAGTATTLFRAAVAWHVFAISKSAFDLGLIGLVQFVPALGLTLVAGAAADTYDRRRMMMLAELASLLGGGALFVATERGGATLPILFGAIFVLAVAAAFDSPARSALLPTLVPRSAFPRAVTISSTAQALAFVSGPGLAGLVIADAGVGAAYAAFAALLALSLAALALLRSPGVAGRSRGLSLEAVREGLGFVRRQRVILGCMALDLFAVIFGGATALLPIYADAILHVGARGYGLLTSSLEIGALLMSGILILRPPLERAGRALVVAVAGFGFATIVFGFSRWFPLSVAAYMAVGMADQVSVVMRNTAIQLSTPDALRGRVSSVNMIFINASNQLGAVESGFVAAATSAPFAVVSGGIACLVALAVIAARLPELRRYRLGAASAASSV